MGVTDLANILQLLRIWRRRVLSEAELYRGHFICMRQVSPLCCDQNRLQHSPSHVWGRRQPLKPDAPWPTKHRQQLPCTVQANLTPILI